MNLNTVLEFSSTSIHQAAGQVETTADAAWWTLRPSRSLQLCVCIYIMFSPCSHPVPQGVYISSPKISTRHNHCPTTSQAAPPPLPGEQKTAKRLRVTQNDLYDDPRSAHSINPTDDVHNFRRNRGDVRNAPWFREPIKGLTSQSQRPDLFSHEWWDRSIATEIDTLSVSTTAAGLVAGSYSASVTITEQSEREYQKNHPPGDAVDYRSRCDTYNSTQHEQPHLLRHSWWRQPGGGTLSWPTSDNAAWLTLSPVSGTNSGTVTTSVNLTGLAAATYSAIITVAASVSTSCPQQIPVS